MKINGTTRTQNGNRQMLTRTILRKPLGFLRSEKGTATIEFVLIVPLFLALIGLCVDASTLYTRQSVMLNVARDTARIVSRNAMTTTEAKAYAERIASTQAATATATVGIVNGYVTVQITAPAEDLAPMGIITFAMGRTVSATSTSIMEPA